MSAAVTSFRLFACLTIFSRDRSLAALLENLLEHQALLVAREVIGVADIAAGQILLEEGTIALHALRHCSSADPSDLSRSIRR